MKRIIGLVMIAILPLMAGVITETFTFSESDFHFDTFQDYDVITLTSGLATDELGSPLLPQKIVKFLIPCDAEVVGVRVVSKIEDVIPGSYHLLPVQKPVAFSHQGPIEFIPPDEAVYASTSPYPAEDMISYPLGSKSGYRIAGVGIFPVRYVPAEEKLILTRSITIQVEYEQGHYEPFLFTEMQHEVFSREVRALIVNPEDILIFAPPYRGDRGIDDINYVIITSDAFASHFQSLADWRTKQGWRAEIKTISWINANYPGYDQPERIRNFIKDYFINKGLVWVLLGGDHDVVPTRLAYLGNPSPPPSKVYVATDLYYSDLDGTWDENNNHLYGENIGDGVDIYPDVFVGRIPVNDTTTTANYTQKVNRYEKNPVTSYIKRMLLPSVMLFPQLSYHGRIVNNAIADTTPASWFDIKLEDPSASATPDSFSHGFQFCHGATHGTANGWYTSFAGPVFVRNNIPGLTNDSMYNIANSIACYAGCFDQYECFAESLVNKYPGACVAAIMNTRLGWGTPPGLGPSELLDLTFYAIFFNRDTLEIGRCHARDIDFYRDAILASAVWRYCGCELTLFGDPALPMWEEIPVYMNVSYPSEVSVGQQDISVTVTTGGSPVNHALVCLYKENECHESGYTEASGQITLHALTWTSGTMYITVTARDCYPFEGTIQVGQPDYAYIQYLKSSISDPGGNNNHQLNPGESVEIPTWVKNIGLQTGYSIQGILRISDSLVVLADTIKSFGDIVPGDSAQTSDGYDLALSSSATNGYVIQCTLLCQDNVDSNWISTFLITVAAPVLMFVKDSIFNDDNANGILEPGETASLTVTIKNEGLQEAEDIVAILRKSSPSPYLTIIDSTAIYENILPDSSRNNVSDPYVVSADSGALLGTVIELELHVDVSNGYYTAIFPFSLVIGEGADYATHDCGNCKFSVTRYGALGFMGSAQSGGMGFKYPATGTNHLFYGSFCAGTDESYVVDRYYGSMSADDEDWVTTHIPHGEVLWYEPGPHGEDEYSTAHYSDSGHAMPRGLICDQYSWAWSDEDADDFVTMQFVFHNQGGIPITNLYAAIFIDWDIGNAGQNTGSTDPQRNLAWMHQSSPYLGQLILDPSPDSTHLIANLALIDHSLYVYPFGGLPDSIQIQFMDGTIACDTTDRPYDWSLCTSAGPFTLNPGDSIPVTFALVGGASLADLKAHADSAFLRYWGYVPGVEEHVSGLPSGIRLYSAISYQRPFVLHYALNQETSLHIKVYNVVGRLVHTQKWPKVSGHGEVSFMLNHLSQGVYFVRVEAGEYNMTQKIILLR